MNPKEIRALIRESAKGMMLGPFTLPREAELKAKPDLVIQSTSPSGHNAFAATYRLTPREIPDFTGAHHALPAGAMLIDIIGYRGDVQRITQALSRRLREKYSRPVLMRIFEEDKALRAVLTDWAYVTSNVSPYAEVFGYYALDKAMNRVRMPESEHWTLRQVYAAKIISRAEQEALLGELKAFNVAWADHYSNYNKGHTWSAYALRGYGDPSFIIKPSEMTAKWQRANPEWMAHTVHDTPALASFPTVSKILARIPGAKDRVRLMRLSGGGELLRHCDISDKDAGIANGKVARLHIPLVTSDAVEFNGVSDRGTHVKLTMEERHLYYLDQRKPHWVVNRDPELDRIHLVIDVVSSFELRQLFS